MLIIKNVYEKRNSVTETMTSLGHSLVHSGKFFTFPVTKNKNKINEILCFGLLALKPKMFQIRATSPSISTLAVAFTKIQFYNTRRRAMSKTTRLSAQPVGDSDSDPNLNPGQTQLSS